MTNAEKDLNKIYQHYIEHGKLDEDALPQWVRQQRANVLSCVHTGEHVFHPAGNGPCVMCKGMVRGGKAKEGRK